MDPLPIWYAPYGDEAAAGYPVHALTQRPMDMYHSWGSQNAWLRQIKGRNYLYLPTKDLAGAGLSDGDWARVSSAGTIVVPVAHMAALNETPSGPGTPSASARGLGAGRRARGDDGVPAEPPDFGTVAGQGWAAAVELGPGDRAGGLVRPAMKKCTLCVDRIYNETLAEVERVPACVSTCPVGARHFGDLGDPQSSVSQLVAEREGYDLMPEMGYRPTNKYLAPRPRRNGSTASCASKAAQAEPVVEAAALANHPFLRWVDRLLTR
jgi:ferredoxin